MRKLYVEKHIEIQQWIITQMDQAKFRQASPQCGPLNEERTDSLTSQIRMVALLCLCERAGSWEERDSVRPSIRPSVYPLERVFSRPRRSPPKTSPKRLKRRRARRRRGGQRGDDREGREGGGEREAGNSSHPSVPTCHIR